jgi:hypothetical protein
LIAAQIWALREFDAFGNLRFDAFGNLVLRNLEFDDFVNLEFDATQLIVTSPSCNLFQTSMLKERRSCPKVL